jgi:hypothetical protein
MNQLPVKVTPDKMWDNVLKTEFTNGSADGIKELRYLFGVDNPNFKAGNELFNRARSRYIWDAFFKSFDKQPEIAGKTIADRMADAERMGAVNFAGKQDVFEMAGTKDLEAITRLDPVLAQRYKLGEVNAMDLKLKQVRLVNLILKNLEKQWVILMKQVKKHLWLNGQRCLVVAHKVELLLMI